MKIEPHSVNGIKIAEVVSDQIVINNVYDGLNLMANLYYQDYDRIILHEKNITAAFFDLSTRIAGEILQKFSNYRVRLAIVGDFSRYTSRSKSLKDFIFESNKGNQVHFVASLPEALQVLSGG